MYSMTKLDHAISLAEKYHKGQKRRNGTDYIQHCDSVLNILKKCNFKEENLLIAAVLHDICEDTNIDNLKISKLFGERIGFVINALSKNKKPQKENATQTLSNKHDGNQEDFNYRFWMYINRFSSGIKNDPYILFIKMADQIDNLATIEVFSKKKQERKLREIEEFFLPIYERVSNELDIKYKKQYLSLKSQLIQIIKAKKKQL